MHKLRCYSPGIVRTLLLVMALCVAGQIVAQTPAARKSANAPTVGMSSSATDERAVEDTRQQLIKLLRMTPVLTSAVAHDPSLLAEQGYVARSNPALAQFLESHPEITRNPEFYLFANPADGRWRGKDRAQMLQRQVWPDMTPPEVRRSAWNDVGPFLAVTLVVGGVLWLIRLFVDGFRWKRTFKAQTEMQNKLLDKFGASQDLIAYLETDAGKRILQSPTIPSSMEQGVRPGGMLGRMLTPLQLGAVLIPVGIGLRILQYSFPETERGFLVLGTLALTLGIGLVAAAGVSWLMARQYGLLPQPAEWDGAGQAGQQ